VSAPVLSLICWDTVRAYLDSSARAHALLAVWVLFLIIPWIGVQASEVRSLERFRDLLRLDPVKGESGWDYLSSYYFHRNRMDEWGQCNIEALRYSDNPRYHANAALFFSMKRDWPNAKYQAGLARMAIMADSVLSEWETNVSDPSALISLGKSYEQQSYVNDARQSYDVAARLQPDSPLPLIASADLLLRMRSFEDAQNFFDKLAELGQTKLDQARQYFGLLSAANASDQQTRGWLGLCMVSAARGDSLSAEQNARKAFTISREEKTMQFLSRMYPQVSQANP
jgi:tetratricopeptide (TPR) repeat protein